MELILMKDEECGVNGMKEDKTVAFNHRDTWEGPKTDAQLARLAEG